MASGSMRETIRLLASTFSAPTVPYPLPDELHDTIEAFLERYNDVEGHDSQRFHDDLLALYTKHVATSPEKRASFLRALRTVRPALTGEARLNEWWNLLLKPTLEEPGHKKSEIENVQDIIQGILVYEAGEDKDGELARLSSHFLQKIIDGYLARTRIPSSTDDVLSSEDELVSHEYETILVAFGRKKPKELLNALDSLFVQRKYRIQALNLLSSFVRLQPPHLYLVLETSLVQNIEKCLLIDTSSTVIELALMILIMFLPHIAGSLPSDHHLAKLFLIYSRILCWDKFAASEGPDDMNEKAEADENSSSECEDDEDQSWEKASHSIEYPDVAPPTLLHYFTFLYGLFPLNFMTFVRKPRKFLKAQNFPGADDFDLDQDLIHSRTEPYRRVHLLHPNMFITTLEDEIAENRWLKYDPADIVTECMDLCVAVSSSLDDPGPPPSSKLPELPLPPLVTDISLDDDGAAAHESRVSWRNTQSTMFASSAIDAPEPFDIPAKPKSVKSSMSASPLLKARDVMDSPTLPPLTEKKKPDFAAVSLFPPHHAANSSFRLGSFAQTVTTGATSPTPSEFQNHTMASLQREIMLLRNDLNFERYLKQQHMSHIGQLQRRHIKEATAEAETQNLINTNRTLKARLAKANEMYAQLKKETLTSRSQSKKWEGELSAKVRSYRDEQKSWQGEEDNLRFELKRTQHDYENLKKICEKAEAERLQAQQRARALEFELEDYGNVRRELEAVQDKISTFEDQGKELNALTHERNELRNDLEVANLRLSSRELERDHSIKAYERRISELETRLQAAERNTGKSGQPGQLSSSVQQMIDSALAAKDAKLQQLKKVHHRLLEQYTELQMKYHELEGEQQAEFGRMTSQEKYGHQHYPQEKESFGRSFIRRQSSAYGSTYLSPVSHDIPAEDYEYYGEYQSPRSPGSPSTPISPPRPVRLESLDTRRPIREPTNVGFGQDFSAAYDASLNAHFQATNSTDLNSSGKSTLSEDTSDSKGDKKDKVVPKSEVRVYGRGGAQNIGKKVKDKEQKKTGGFRGLKGIM